MNLRNALGWLFGFIADLVNGAEKSFLDFLSALVPYCVPIIPAFLTYQHTMKEMQFDEWVAVTAAFVVETLGMASVSTAIRFYYHNQRYKNDKNQAPFKLALSVYLFYIVIVMTVNVVLESVAHTRTPTVIFAIALFTLLSVPSGVLIAIRAQYSELLGDMRARYHRNNPAPQTAPQPGTYKKDKHASDYREQILSMLDAEYSKSGQVLPPKSITSRLRLDHARNKGYVSGLTKEWKSGKGIS